ncbi:hypothetical protein ATE49_10005 [Elizabethkingia miricola]|uniref:Uncharacterized protein n=1 Tax=Elizabethkingia miricola TaxID=172045 RepID=A0ABY3NLN2_ELIMR|nr:MULTISPECIES: hypothetical protein [Elizabethkingia]OBS11964.1 hypothetical protein ATE49_10005 [Elizabethkingia miricola]TYO93781.1 hypothetical protein LX74_00866 [Elizabethkingia miricola]
MNILTNEVIENLNDSKVVLNPFLFSHRVHSESDIKQYGLPIINKEKQLYLDNNRSSFDFIIGTKFNVVFRRKDVKGYQKIDAELDFVSLKKGDNIGILPRGYGGIVRLTFKDKTPEMIKFLVQNDKEKYDDLKNDIIYFTTQKVMDEILKELEKTENP